MAKSYFTSNTLIADIKRRSMIPSNQSTFQTADFLALANDELAIGVIPSILQVHEEYFVYSSDVTLVSGQSSYAIPYRAIGGKLRDLFYKDTQGNLIEMSRIAEEDISYYQTSSLANRFMYFYVKGNDIVLLPTVSSTVTGSLTFVYYLRPNQLVEETRVATIQSYNESTLSGSISNISVADPTIITSVGHGLSTNNYITISGSNSTPSIDGNYYVTVIDNDTFSIDFEVTSLGTSGSWSCDIVTMTMDQIPSGFTVSQNYDLLQAKPGHRTINFDVSPTSIDSTNLQVMFNANVIPSSYTLEAGDYLAFSEECIIPQIPDELHSVLSQRVALRCMDALGDQAGVQSGTAKLNEMENKTATLIDNRVDGATLKVNNIRGLLRQSKMNRRRWY